jgi:hypothetical protein
MADRTKPSPPPPVGPESLRAGYEVTDASARGIFLTGLFALTVGFVIHLLLWWLFLTYQRAWRADQKPRSAIAHEAEAPPAPRLQLDPRIELSELRRRNLDLLTHAGWVDRPAGWAHIPIEDAMELVVRENQKGGTRK